MGKNLAFDASNAVDPFDYDLAPWSDEKGTVPEPSADAVAAFYTSVQQNYQETLSAERLEGYDLTNIRDLTALSLTLTVDETKALYDKSLDTYAEVCAGSPTREGLEALPFRLRQAFYGAIMGWLRPEA